MLRGGQAPRIEVPRRMVGDLGSVEGRNAGLSRLTSGYESDEIRNYSKCCMIWIAERRSAKRPVDDAVLGFLEWS